jgi:putative oxidoreductase
MSGKFLFLGGLERYGDVSLFTLRLLTGAFLMWETQDNILSAARMAEFEGFLAHHGLIWPSVMAPLSVYAQFVCGALFVLGLLTRWAGLVMVFNFVVAVVMVLWAQDFRGWWPAIVLVAISLHFALQGAGAISLDRWLNRRKAA